MIRIYELSFGHNSKTDMTTILDHKTNTIIAEFDDYNVATYFVKKCFKLILKDKFHLTYGKMMKKVQENYFSNLENVNLVIVYHFSFLYNFIIASH